MSLAVCITVDVDGEAGLPDGGRHHGRHLTARSERRYGVRRGMPRVLALLEAFDAAATFYVPGVTAERHPEAIRTAGDAGHEIGHHGHRHLATHRLDPESELLELHDGLAAIEAATGCRPRGYRSPGWELTPATLGELGRLGFAYDSSLMGDDRPYWVEDVEPPLLELPVHWALDDAPHFDRTADPAGLASVWRAELASAIEEDRTVTYTLHPEVLGRAHRLDVLRLVLEDARRAGAPVRTHAEVHRLESGRS